MNAVEIKCEFMRVAKYPSGAERFLCPVCGRDAIVKFSDGLISIIASVMLDEGDPDSVAHDAALGLLPDLVEGINFEGLT